jgi:hypothetical protein
MDNGKDEERLFIGRVGDKKVAYRCEPYGPVGEVGSPMALVRKRNQRPDGFLDFSLSRSATSRCLPP